MLLAVGVMIRLLVLSSKTFLATSATKFVKKSSTRIPKGWKQLIKETVALTSEAVNASVNQVMRKMDERHARRCEAIETEVKGTNSKCDKFAIEQEDLRRQIAQLQQAYPDASIATPFRDISDDADFDRRIDATIARISVNDMVSKSNVQAVLALWLDDIGIDIANHQQAQLDNPTLGRRFVVRFPGRPGFAEKKRDLALRSLKDKDGTWKRFWVNTPTCEAKEVRISPEKS